MKCDGNLEDLSKLFHYSLVHPNFYHRKWEKLLEFPLRSLEFKANENFAWSFLSSIIDSLVLESLVPLSFIVENVKIILEFPLKSLKFIKWEL